MFDEEDIIYSYTDEQAIDDGVLVDISKFSKAINRATHNLLAQKGYIVKEEINIPNLKDLIFQCILYMTRDTKKQGRQDWFYKVKVEFPNGESGSVFVVQNEGGSYTVMLPEDY